MSKIPKETIGRWIAAADAHFEGWPSNRHSVHTGAVAWALAGKLGFLNEAYMDRSVYDAHIKTALVQVFPNARFSDAYHY